jgi:thiol-disulfide isomerase/thioredoxin
VLLVYATWCPKCNDWSGELFSQLKEAIAEKPVVVLAINADNSPARAKPYVAQRQFVAPNILHGHDSTIDKRLGFESNLFRYMLVGPDGNIQGNGSAGSFTPGDGGKQFALVRRLEGADDLGTFDFIAPGMSPEARKVLWNMELGFGDERALKAAQGQLDSAQQAEIDQGIEKFLDGQIALIRKNYKGTLEERLTAYDAADRLSQMFQHTPQNKKAKQVVTFMEQDSDFKREAAAKRAYDKVLARTAGDPRRRGTMLRAVGRRFEGTHYGEMAAQAE